MDIPVVLPGQLYAPLALSPVRKRLPTSGEVPAAVSGNGDIQSLLAQSLRTIGDLAGTGDSPFIPALQSALQADPVASSLFSGSSALPEQVLDSSSLLLQALNSEVSAGSSAEIPLVAPYQLGLQAAQELAFPGQSLDQTIPGQLGAAPTGTDRAFASLTQNLAVPGLLQGQGATLAGPTEIVALGVADPTASSLFQAHSGAVMANQFPASGLLGPSLAETLTTLRVTETSAGSGTSAYSEGKPLEPTIYALNPAPPERVSILPGEEIPLIPGATPAYSSQGIPIMTRTQIGTRLNLTG